jgi:hypothetical protein
VLRIPTHVEELAGVFAEPGRGHDAQGGRAGPAARRRPIRKTGAAWPGDIGSTGRSIPGPDAGRHAIYREELRLYKEIFPATRELLSKIYKAEREAETRRNSLRFEAQFDGLLIMNPLLWNLMVFLPLQIT